MVLPARGNVTRRSETRAEKRTAEPRRRKQIAHVRVLVPSGRRDGLGFSTPSAGHLGRTLSQAAADVVKERKLGLQADDARATCLRARTSLASRSQNDRARRLASRADEH